MSESPRGPAPRPFRWAVTGRRLTWHLLLPTAQGAYRYALCGYEPRGTRSWGPMLPGPPRLGRRRWCATCRALAPAQGAPPY
jgi:hypothetical protein